MSYREEVSVDDIITDPEVGREFVAMCREITPTGRPMDFKWAALRLRKMRAFSREKREKLLSVDPRAIEEQMRAVATLDAFNADMVTTDGGIFSFKQISRPGKYLYVGVGLNLRESLRPFEDARPFRVVGGPMWKVAMSDICVQAGVITRKTFGASPRDLSLRLIEERHPLFNVPVDMHQAEDETDE